MPTQGKMMRLPREVKRAIYSGEGYENYKTLVQFHTRTQTLLEARIHAMEEFTSEFYESGGTMEETEDGCTVAMGETRYTVAFGKDGRVARYSVENPLDEDAMRYLHGLFFVLYMLPIYRSTLEHVKRGLADMENSNVLKGLDQIRKVIRDDKYLTVAAISGLEVRVEEEVDPFEVFGNE